MTSANTVLYDIYNKKGEIVGTHSQNVMCMRCNDGLDKFTPASDFKIRSYGYDEEEDLWEGKKVNLQKWLDSNPAEFTHRVFLKGEKVRVKRKGEGTIINSVKGKWEHKYIIELENGDVLVEVSQNQVLPITT